MEDVTEDTGQTAAMRNSEGGRPANAELDMTELWLRQSTASNSDLPAPVSLLPVPRSNYTFNDFGRGERRKFSEPGLCSRS